MDGGDDGPYVSGESQYYYPRRDLILLRFFCSVSVIGRPLLFLLLSTVRSVYFVFKPLERPAQPSVAVLVETWLPSARAAPPPNSLESPRVLPHRTSLPRRTRICPPSFVC